LAFTWKIPPRDPKEVIESEQVKYMLTHYLTSKATAKKISEGFVELMEKGNPKESGGCQPGGY
jgi:hypothetical protein